MRNLINVAVLKSQFSTTNYGYFFKTMTVQALFVIKFKINKNGNPTSDLKPHRSISSIAGALSFIIFIIFTRKTFWQFLKNV